MAYAMPNWTRSISLWSALQTSESVPDYTVCTFSNHILNVILLGNVERDLARTRLIRGSVGHLQRAVDAGVNEEDSKSEQYNS